MCEDNEWEEQKKKEKKGGNISGFLGCSQAATCIILGNFRARYIPCMCKKDACCIAFPVAIFVPLGVVLIVNNEVFFCPGNLAISGMILSAKFHFFCATAVVIYYVIATVFLCRLERGFCFVIHRDEFPLTTTVVRSRSYALPGTHLVRHCYTSICTKRTREGVRLVSSNDEVTYGSVSLPMVPMVDCVTLDF